MILEGTTDEKMALTLENKIIDINQAIEAGATETELEEKLGGSEEDILAGLFASADNYIGDEYE
jgi:hypothetical protein